MNPTIFVGMPFGSRDQPQFLRDCQAVFEAIEGVCADLGVEACRVDQFAGSNGITKQIKRLIEDAHLCIFDLTAERPNVYYEVGYAHGVGHTGDTIIFIAREGTRLHFDLAHRAVLFFADTEDLRAKLAAELEALLDDEDEIDTDDEDG